MAKTKFNGSMKWIVAFAGLLITIGAICQMVRSNTGRIDKVEVKAEIAQNDVTGIKKDIQYIKEGIDELRNR